MSAARGTSVPEDSMQRVACPKCGHRLKYAVARAGRQARCPKCSASIPLPPFRLERLQAALALGLRQDLKNIGTYEADVDDLWQALVAFHDQPAYELRCLDAGEHLAVYRDASGLWIGFHVTGEDGRCELQATTPQLWLAADQAADGKELPAERRRERLAELILAWALWSSELNHTISEEHLPYHQRWQALLMNWVALFLAVGVIGLIVLVVNLVRG